MHLILTLLALMMAWYALKAAFYLCLWLALQPVLAGLWLVSWVTRHGSSPLPPLPSNVIRFPGPRA